MVVCNGKLFFVATDGDKWVVNDGTNHGRELWSTDGTDVGTTMVKNICTDNAVDKDTGSSFLRQQRGDVLSAFEDKVYFTALSSLGYFPGLWSSDGTAVGTKALKYPLFKRSDQPSQIYSTIVFNSKLYFAAGPNDGSNGEELWSTDGTEVGTKM